jgi:hypothetical protein
MSGAPVGKRRLDIMHAIHVRLSVYSNQITSGRALWGRHLPSLDN